MNRWTSPRRAMAAIDWRTVLLLLPRRRFTAAELARAEVGEPNATVRMAFVINIGFPMVLLWSHWGRTLPGAAVGWLVALTVLLLAALRVAWRNPSHGLVRQAYWLVPMAAGVVAGLYSLTLGLSKDQRLVLIVLPLMLASLGLWVTIVYRHQHIVLRLAELDERAQALEMARRLSAAQLAPHFLFNTLAALEHWVATQDARAPALLAALNAYLRATLPMFDRPAQPLADELAAVRHYLQVMALRLGERLHWQVDVPDALGAEPLPPGLLLTLVENAIEHGISPSLRGGQVQISAQAQGAGWCLSVRDDGPGPVAGTADGVGLANVRHRLALAHGQAARLRLDPGPDGGAVATVQFDQRAVA